jgi:hypothetical protein
VLEHVGAGFAATAEGIAAHIESHDVAAMVTQIDAHVLGVLQPIANAKRFQVERRDVVGHRGNLGATGAGSPGTMAGNR